MGMSVFLQRVQANYVKEQKRNGLSPDAPLSDPERLREFLWRDFTEWFLINRDDLLAEEWIRRGWACRLDSTEEESNQYEVKPEFVDDIDKWLNDEID